MAPKGFNLELGERLASLESAVRESSQIQARDRREQMEAAREDRKEIKDLILQNSRICTDSNRATALRLDMHDDLIQQGKGASKTLTKIGAFFGVIWAGLEAFFHYKH